eukprot:3965001-Amphidinium_carterae.1
MANNSPRKKMSPLGFAAVQGPKSFCVYTTRRYSIPPHFFLPGLCTGPLHTRAKGVARTPEARTPYFSSQVGQTQGWQCLDLLTPRRSQRTMTCNNSFPMP